MESNPIVKWARNKVGNKVNFFRLDIRSRVGKQVMKKYAIPINSAYVIFDGEGNEVWRSYAIPFRGRKAIQIINNLLNENRN